MVRSQNGAIRLITTERTITPVGMARGICSLWYTTESRLTLTTNALCFQEPLRLFLSEEALWDQTSFSAATIIPAKLHVLSCTSAQWTRPSCSTRPTRLLTILRPVTFI